jgi:transmembrane 9 superfamily protein 1
VDGNRQIASPYAIAFKADAAPATLCTRSLSPADVARLRSAVLANWVTQFRLDGLPVYSFLGRADAPDRPGVGARARLFTHHHFDLKFNGDRVVEATVRTDPDQR